MSQCVDDRLLARFTAIRFKDHRCLSAISSEADLIQNDRTTEVFSIRGTHLFDIRSAAYKPHFLRVEGHEADGALWLETTFVECSCCHQQARHTRSIIISPRRRSFTGYGVIMG